VFCLLDNREDFFLTDDEDFFAVDFDCLAGILAEQDFVANFDVHFQDFAIFSLFAGTNG
jgi:hypothetical protein